MADEVHATEIECLALAPAGFRERAERVLAATGRTPAELRTSVEAIAALHAETAALGPAGSFAPSGNDPSSAVENDLPSDSQGGIVTR